MRVAAVGILAVGLWWVERMRGGRSDWEVLMVVIMKWCKHYWMSKGWHEPLPDSSSYRFVRKYLPNPGRSAEPRLSVQSHVSTTCRRYLTTQVCDLHVHVLFDRKRRQESSACLMVWTAGHTSRYLGCWWDSFTCAKSSCSVAVPIETSSAV
jgi:hypothetical protein